MKQKLCRRWPTSEHYYNYQGHHIVKRTLDSENIVNISYNDNILLEINN
jgi:hypothetical protein